jgi:hypothetical protein
MSNRDKSEIESVDDQSAASEQPHEEVLLSWETHPAKDRPLVAVIVGTFLVVLACLVYLWTESWFFVAITALVLWGSLSQFYVRTKFVFTGNKVKVHYVVNKIEKEWSQYRSFYEDKNGVLLSPFLRPSRLENFRGLYVRFAHNRDQVMEIVKQKIQIPEDDIDA